MTINLLPCVSIFIMLICTSKADVINMKPAEIPSAFEKITIYDTDPGDRREWTDENLDVLLKFTSYQVESDIVKTLLANAMYRDKFMFWKGGSLALAELKNGEIIQLKISYYGNVFKVIGIPGYYKVPIINNMDWSKIWKRIIDKVFIPARKNNNQNNR